MNLYLMKENNRFYYLHPRLTAKITLQLRKIKLCELLVFVY